MRKPVVLDTDVMVDFLRGQAEAVAFVKSHSDRIILSAIVVAELYAGVKDDEERALLDELIKVFRVVPVTAELAKTGGHPQAGLRQVPWRKSGRCHRGRHGPIRGCRAEDPQREALPHDERHQTSLRKGEVSRPSARCPLCRGGEFCDEAFQKPASLFSILRADPGGLPQRSVPMSPYLSELLPKVFGCRVLRIPARGLPRSVLETPGSRR